MSLGFAREIMEMDLDPENKHFAKILSAKQAITQSMLTATARIRAGLLKPSEDDGMDEVLAALKKTAGEEEPPPTVTEDDVFG
jgi:hypothetical protein